MTEADHSVGMGEDVKRWFRWACLGAAALGWGFGFWIWFECWRIRGLM
ncbi:MAG: hypothetical protein ACTTKW_01160 [Schwartzia sp. (in: firmicutes)]